MLQNFKKNRCNNILLQFKKKEEYYCPYVRKKNIKYIFEKTRKSSNVEDDHYIIWNDEIANKA